MTAVLERELEQTGQIDGFQLVHTSLSHPQVAALRQAYFERMGIPPFQESPVVRWFGLAKEDELFVAVGACRRFDGGVEITDIYAKPCKEGVRASELVLQFLKVLVDARKIPYFFGIILTKNTTGQRHFEKYFHKHGPDSLCYIYGGPH